MTIFLSILGTIVIVLVIVGYVILKLADRLCKEIKEYYE